MIWSINHPNVHIHTFRKRWSLIEDAFSLWVSLKRILLQPVKTISIQICHVLWVRFIVPAYSGRIEQNTVIEFFVQTNRIYCHINGFKKQRILIVIFENVLRVKPLIYKILLSCHKRNQIFQASKGFSCRLNKRG